MFLCFHVCAHAADACLAHPHYILLLYTRRRVYVCTCVCVGAYFCVWFIVWARARMVFACSCV